MAQNLNYDTKPRGVPTAAGHNTFPLEKQFRREFEDVFYCTEDIMDCATNRTLEPLRSCGQTIEWMTSPKGVLHDYYINQRLKNDFPEWGKNSCTIGHAKYWNMKVDHVNMQMMCDDHQIFQEVMRDLMRQKADVLTAALIREMILGAHPKNQGKCAGVKKKSYNLGECDCCLPIDCDCIRKFNRVLWNVLSAQCVVKQRRPSTSNDPGSTPFMMVPSCYFEVYEEANDKGCCPASEPSALDSGETGMMHGGFMIKEVSMLEEFAVQQEDDSYAYPIIFGRQDATGAVMTIDKTREVRDHPDYFADFMQGLFVYGQCVINRQALGVAWVCFDAKELGK
jgi:hypothetical protein